MRQEHYLLSEVARAVGIKPHRLAYMLTNNAVEEPRLRIGGKRVFTHEEVERIREIVAAKDRTEGREARR